MLHPKPGRPNTDSHGTPTALSYKSFRWCRRGLPGKTPSYFRRYSFSKLLTPSFQPHAWINSNENFAERSPSHISEWILPLDAPLKWSGSDLLSSSCEGLFRSPITEAGRLANTRSVQIPYGVRCLNMDVMCHNLGPKMLQAGPISREQKLAAARVLSQFPNRDRLVIAAR
jgi:hypothetical protein